MEIEKCIRSVKINNVVITSKMIKKQTKDIKQSASGNDELHGFWLKHLMTFYEILFGLMKYYRLKALKNG